MQAIERLCETKTPDAAVFCGDLTTRGQLPTYVQCVSYLNRTLGLAEGRFWTMDGIHAVPGNHDVDRKLADPAGEDFLQKFAPLEETWRAEDLDILACAAVRPTQVEGSEGVLATVYSINSCIGCGEKRARQGEFTDAKAAELEARSEDGDSAATDLLWEGLDTPLFAEDQLGDLNDSINELGRKQLPVVVTHHNLLPQAVPRADIYTELFNGGAARVRLSAHDRWVLYLHGHIHDDPIEVIEQRYPGAGKVLAISAPLLEDGFNVISIEFGYADRPMGASVVHYRYEKGGDVRPRAQLRIGLASKADEPTQLLGDILSVLGTGTNLRFRDVEAKLTEHRGSQPDRTELCNALWEAEWAGYLAISERDDEPKQWTISREAL